MTPSRPERSPSSHSGQPQRNPKPRRDSGKSRLALALSALIHAAALTGFVVYNSLPTRAVPAVPVFQMVPVQPKLRPIEPKAPEPPPPPEKVETRPPEAPKLAAKPKKPPVAKPAPKHVSAAAMDTAKPVKDVPHEAAQPSMRIVADVPSDPRLGFWASRVKKLVETRWNPPDGLDIQGQAKTTVSFQVDRSGAISDVIVSQGSGNPLLDDQARSTILRLDQVPPIPENFPQDVLKVSYEFVYQGQ